MPSEGLLIGLGCGSRPAATTGRCGGSTAVADDEAEAASVAPPARSTSMFIRSTSMLRRIGGGSRRRVYWPSGHTTVFSGQGERGVSHPWGLFGGGEGGLASFSLDFDDGRRQSLPVKPMTVEISPDASVTAITPGAGGYGAPAERAQAELADDLANGLFSADYMKEHYGFEATGGNMPESGEKTET